MSISLQEVRHVAKLARLQLDETEVLSLQSELNAILGHFGDIESIDVSGIDPASHAVSVHNVWSEDLVRNPFPREIALKNAPVSKAGLFMMPMIIEE